MTEPAPLRVGARTGGVHQESVVADRNRSGRVVDRLLGHARAAPREGVRVEEAGRPRRAEQDARAQRGGIGERQRGRIPGVGEAGERGGEERGEIDPVRNQVVVKITRSDALAVT